LHGVPPGGGRRFSTANRTPGGASTAGRGEADGIVSGRSHGRQRAVLMSATGQLHGRLRAVSRVRCQAGTSGSHRTWSRRHKYVGTSAVVETWARSSASNPPTHGSTHSRWTGFGSVMTDGPSTPRGPRFGEKWSTILYINSRSTRSSSRIALRLPAPTAQPGLEVDRLAPRQHEDERVRLLHRGEVSVESLYGPGCDRRWCGSWRLFLSSTP